MSAEAIRRLRVVGRRQLADAVIELRLVAADGAPLPEWAPGAHIDLRLGAELIRQYSLVQTANPDEWTVAVLVEEHGRGGSLAIQQQLTEGAEVDSSGPRNHFPLIEAPRYLFIAGGIGVTPMIGMLRAAESAGADWQLAYLGRERAHMAYLDELLAEFGERVTPFVSGDGDRFEVEVRLAELATDTAVYCCGPDRLMDAVEAAMDDRLDAVHLERFHPRELDATTPNFEFTVYAAKSDVEFTVPDDESILMAADFEGIEVPGDCLEGTCGSCETRVLLGQVEHRDSVLGPQARRESATMMICVSRAAAGCSRLELDL